MNKYFKKFSVMFVMTLILSLGFCISAFADDNGVVGTANLNNTAQNSAVVGKKLTAPEIGWKRYDSNDNKIIDMGNVNNRTQSTTVEWYDNTISDIYNDGNVKFEFNGTKIRILGVIRNETVTQKGTITIDGVEYNVSEYNGTRIPQALVFEKKDLQQGMHQVEISCTDSYAFSFDALDIDSDGLLLPYDESITLDHSSMDLQECDSAELTATTTPAAVGVTWTVSDPTVATIEVDPTNGKIIKITALKEGTCTITATTADGNNLSASCVINVTKKDTTEPTTPPDDSDNKTGATLIINLTDGETKVFDVSASEAAKFKEWYNTKTEYENQITYEFDKTVNSSISIEEDVVHNQVTSYEIRKY